jgi:DNA invertase Pin-like site-specific DNA recombinase
MQRDTQYVPPFIRRLMPTASEAEISEAAENLRGYLLILYRAFLAREAKRQASDSPTEQPHGRFTGAAQKAAPPMKSYVAYIRVSTAKQGQHGSSLQEQRDAILSFANRQNLHIAEWFEDRETAAKKGRTQFMRMMAALEKQRAGGVILHKIDRGARNLWDWARIQDLIDVGVEVHFAHDNLDLTSRGGRLAADIQAVVAADYVRNLRDEVRKGMRGRFKQGFYPLPAPIGYLDQGRAKPKIIDPVKGSLVRAAFDLYAAGRYSLRTLALELQRKGLTRASGQQLSLNTITDMLHNPFYTGIIRLRSTGEVFQGVHEPIVDARTFQVVQDAFEGKGNPKARRFDFTYKRMLTCGLCNRRLTGELQKGRVYYRCHTRGCETKGIREDTVNARLQQVTRALMFTQEEFAEMRTVLEREDECHQQEVAKTVTAMKLRIASLEDRERRLIDAYIDQTIDKDAYNERKSRLLIDLAAARDDLRLAEDGRMETCTTRVQRFFEPLKTLELGPAVESSTEYRAALEKLTSNRTVSRKKLAFAMRSPFRDVIQDLTVRFGGPHRGMFRTCTAQSTPVNKCAPQSDQSIAEGRARILLKHLREWKDPSWKVPEKSKRPPQADWFKSKHSGDNSYPCA